MKKKLVISFIILTVCLCIGIIALSACGLFGCRHEFSEWAEISPASCVADGKRVRACQKCSLEEVDTVDGSDIHRAVTDEAVTPTCTADGLTEGEHCADCGAILKAQTVLKASGHTEVIDVEISATCTMDGQSAGKHCSVCGEVTAAPEVIKATGHSEVTDQAVAATCTADGKTEGKHCTVCGEVTVAPEIIKAKGHSEVTDRAVAATCTADGKTEGKHCTVCGEVTAAPEVIKATGHTEVTDKAIAATCTADGKTEGKHCTVCGEVTVAPEIIKAKGHSEVTDKAVAATCTKEGLTAGKHCSVCKKVTVAQKTVPKTDHKFVNYKCSCGEVHEDARITVMSQNMRYANDGSGKNISDRAPRFKKLVELYAPDIIGTQETTALWNSYFKSYFSGIYGMVGCSRDGVNATSGEWGTILYRLDRFELLDSGNFWLTSTPDKVSRVTGAKCNRICTWALLKDKLTGDIFVMANTHLDHSTDAVRLLQLKYLFAGLSDKIDKYPLYLTGDFNATPNSSVYLTATGTLLDAGVTAKLNTSTISYTFDSYGTKNPGSRIDYCFYNDRSTALWYKVLNEQFNGYVSDHYGIITEFIIK